VRVGPGYREPLRYRMFIVPNLVPSTVQPNWTSANITKCAAAGAGNNSAAELRAPICHRRPDPAASLALPTP